MSALTINSIRSDLRSHYPTLHAYTSACGQTEIAGAFPVVGVDGEVVDRFNIVITIPSTYPAELPIVREVGRRIPRTADRHVFTDGTSCIMYPDDRWRCFPEGSTLMEYLQGPVHNYFLGQSYYEECGEWPMGEWGHGFLGVLEYYQWLAGTDDALTAWRFLYVMTRRTLKPHWDCPCGSGKKIKQCCRRKINDMRYKIPVAMARASFALLEVDAVPYSHGRLRSG